jgi:NADPH-dependent curcumin reductase CurA
VCEHSFVTAQGHPRAEFQRAVERGNLLQAKALAKVVASNTGKLSLGDAVSLLFLMSASATRATRRPLCVGSPGSCPTCQQ